MSISPLLLSFEVAALAVLIAGTAGVGLAALLARSRTVASDVVDGVVTAPMVLPPTVLGYYVLVFFGRESAFGRTYEAIVGSPLVFSRAGAIFAATLGALPLVILSSRAALESIDPTLARAARTLGAGPWRAFVTIEMPLALPGIVAGLVLGFARALGDFGVTLMVAGDIPGSTQTASLAIYDAIAGNREIEAMPMIVALTLTAVLSSVASRRLTRRRVG